MRSTESYRDIEHAQPALVTPDAASYQQAQAWIKEFAEWRAESETKGQPSRAPPPIPEQLYAPDASSATEALPAEVQRLQALIRDLAVEGNSTEEKEDTTTKEEAKDMFQGVECLHPIAPFPERMPPRSVPMNLRKVWEIPEEATDR